MTDKTKEIFSAPWEVSTITGNVINPDGDPICQMASTDDAHRIARLPELYDVLFETAMETCSKCVARHSHIGIVAPAGFDFFAGDCPFENKDYDDDPCRMRQRWKLLGKVRDGK